MEGNRQPNGISGNECSANLMSATELVPPLDSSGLPSGAAWEGARPVTFFSDWQGRNPDPGRETEVRLLWSIESLFIRFRARYREMYVYPGGNSRRDQLWMRDVAELFIRPDTDEPGHYKEFEISPNGYWLDLDIYPGRKTDLLCRLQTRVTVDDKARIWVAEMAIPMSCLMREFDPRAAWRLNFFRVEGPEPHRFYSAWRPTGTSQPNFHVPEVFGELRLVAK